MQTTLTIFLILACSAATARCAQSRGPAGAPQDPVVIGGEAARAAEAEARRKARGEVGPSPMPAGRYEFSPDELDLINPRPQALDAAIGELCRRYAQGTAADRARMRNSISMEEFYTLLNFARRASVFALRERKPERLAEGLTAVAMVEQERVDFRDMLWALSLLHHAARRIGADPAKPFRDAARLAEPETSKLILGFLARPEREKDLRASWGYDEVETEGGPGLIRRDYKPYNPIHDLKRLAVEIARLVAADKYTSASPSVAADLPPVWLEGVDDAALRRALGAVRAGANVAAHLKPGLHPDADSQQFTVFVVETADEAGARTLLDLSKRKRGAGVATLGLAEGRLFCLVVARSFTVGVESFETTESLSRFSRGLAELLRRHAKR